MSAADKVRLSELDRSCDETDLPREAAGDLFKIIEAVSSSLGLRRAFTDPASTSEARKALAQRLFGGKASEAALKVFGLAIELNWRNPHSLLDSLERQGIRILLKEAAENGKLDEAVAQLQDFLSVVSQNSGLREALQNDTYEVAHRAGLVSSLVGGQALDLVEELLRRAVAKSQHNFVITIQSYLQIAAQLRSRQIAQVAVAKELTDEQRARLRGILAHQTGREVDLQIVIDPKVIGGMRIQMADDLIESTVAGRLEDVQRQFSS